jgi:hypothetical protein
MKKFALWISLLLASLASASAQVTVEVTLEQEQFLSGEALPVAVRITNRSGQVLHLGADENWLTFAVESRTGGVASKLGEVPVQGEFDLESSKVAIKHVNLEPYFALRDPGRYSIIATVRVKQWGTEFTSQPKSLNIIEGVKLAEQVVGLPRTSGDTNASPELRKYVLHQVNYHKGQLRLYLRVTDVYGASLRVLPIAPMVTFGRPETQVDNTSNFHVLNQTGPSSFNYAVFNPNGDCLKRQTYDFTETRPHLRLDDQDNIVVVGGARRVADTDLPPPLSASATNTDTNTPSRTDTNTPPQLPPPAK